MHGVSNKYMLRAFETYGFPPFTPVQEQSNPDPEFPTVQFPNPEEKGALVSQDYDVETHCLTCCLEFSCRNRRKREGTLCLSPRPGLGSILFRRTKVRGAVSDINGCLFKPDHSADGSWTTFTGDQLGVLFASAVLDEYKTSGRPLGMSNIFLLNDIY